MNSTFRSWYQELHLLGVPSSNFAKKRYEPAMFSLRFLLVCFRWLIDSQINILVLRHDCGLSCDNMIDIEEAFDRWLEINYYQKLKKNKSCAFWPTFFPIRLLPDRFVTFHSSASATSQHRAKVTLLSTSEGGFRSGKQLERSIVANFEEFFWPLLNLIYASTSIF